jgi:PAS domain S-box-containing protein
MKWPSAIADMTWIVIVGLLILLGLNLLVHPFNYLLFHSLAEIFSILVAGGIFVIAWNGRGFIASPYLLFLGIAYLFVGGIDLIHTLAYDGMGVFPEADANLPTQLWIGARYLQGISLVIAPLIAARRFNPYTVFWSYAGVTSLLLLSIFVWDIFPDCLLPGVGLTPFKIFSEYVICLLLVVAIALTRRQRHLFDPPILRLIIASIAVTIASELSFTLYQDVYGITNMVGHLLKILAFYLLYRAIIARGLKEPHSLLFRTLKQNEVLLRRANEELEVRVQERTTELEQRNQDLGDRLAFERLIGHISTQFVNLTADDLDDGIQEALRQITNFTDFDRSFIFLLSDGGAIGHLTYEYCADGIEPSPPEWHHIPAAPFPWWMGKLNALETIEIPRPADLPAEATTEQQALLSAGIRSVVVVPLVYGRELLGYIGFSALRQEKTWSQHEISLLRLVGELFANALQRKQTDEALGWQAQILSQIHDSVISATLEGQVISWNQGAERLFGYRAAEAIGQHISFVFAGDESDTFLQKQVVEPLLEQGTLTLEVKRRRKDGKLIDVSLFLSLLRDRQQQPTGMVAYGIDITERKRMETALRESEERYRTVISALSEGITLRQADGKIIACNASAERILGLPQEKILGHSCLDAPWQAIREDGSPFPGPEHPAMVTLRTGEPQKNVIMGNRNADGSTTWLSVNSQPLMMPGETAPYAVVTSFTDISDRLQMELDLRASQERLDSILNSLEDVVWSASAGDVWDTIYVNPAIAKIYGRPQQEFLDNPYLWLEAVHPDDLERVQVEQMALHERGIKNLEYRILRPDGEVRWISDRAHTVYDDQGNAIRYDGIASDITERKKAEQALRESEERWQLALRGNNDGIWDWNVKTGEVFFSARWKEMLGFAEDEVAHTLEEWSARVHPDDIDWVMEAIQDHFAQKTPYYITEHRVLCKDGSYKWILDRGQALWDERGNVIRMTGSHTDITERRRAEEAIRHLNADLEQRVAQRTEDLRRANEELRQSQEVYRQMFEFNQAVKLLIDPETGTIVDANSAAANFYGYPLEHLKRMSVQDLDTLTQQQVMVALQQTVRDRQGHWFFRHQLACGELRDVEVYYSLLNLQGKQMLHSIVHDITDRKRAEEQLRLSNERISLANAELARAARLKDEFLASMSHELRTPLNAVLGLSEALQEEVYGPLTERQRRSLVSIEQSGKHLLALINDILDLSKIESGKMELQRVPASIRELCTASLAFVQQDANQRNIKLHCEIPADIGEVEFDERRMRQALINLLSNAVKFTPDGGEVTVKVESDRAHSILQISVIDTGIGIAPENMERLFQPFVQLDSSLTRRYAGTGLGLSLVRRIMELHGGSITLDSTEGKGSCFTLNLPWHVLAHKLEIPPPEPAPQTSQPALHRAFVIEDSTPAASQIGRYLTELGASVVVYPRAEGAFERILQASPEVIILDILLPYGSGWDVLQQVNQDPRTRDIPVVIVSVMDEREKGLALGAAEYVVKPISRQQFQRALQQVIPAIAQPQPSPSPTQPPIILLAEDNEVNITTLVDYLESFNYQVIVARNGLEAVTLTQTQVPDLILMDIQMPEMDGLTATRQIRADQSLTHIPILALTALAMPGDREQCLAAGVNDYLVKPVSLKTLVQTIDQHLKALSTTSSVLHEV